MLVVDDLVGGQVGGEVGGDLEQLRCGLLRCGRRCLRAVQVDTTMDRRPR
jgi:hypothetical protein